MGTLKKWVNKIGRATGLSPGKLPQDPYQSANPYGPNAPQWDETGMPVGPMPRGQYALDYQHEANRRAEQRRNALWGDAQGSMRQAADLFQSYRPGGSAALAANVYGQKANLYGTQAQTIEAPDLLMGYREHERQMAERERKQANKFARTMGIVQLGAQVAGMAMGVPPTGGGVDAPQATPSPGADQPITMEGRQGYDQPIGPPTPAMQGRLGYDQPAGPPVPQGGIQDTAGYGQAMQQRQQLRQQGPQGAPGAAPGAPMQGGAQGGAGQDQPPGGAPGGGGGMGMIGPPPPVEFTSREAASNAMMGSPLANPVVAESWAEDPVRRKSTFLMMAASRERLLAAMA